MSGLVAGSRLVSRFMDDIWGLGMCRGHGLSSTDRGGWASPLPATGDDCKIDADSPGSCEYQDPMHRTATLTLKRTR